MAPRPCWTDLSHPCPLRGRGAGLRGRGVRGPRPAWLRFTSGSYSLGRTECAFEASCLILPPASRSRRWLKTESRRLIKRQLPTLFRMGRQGGDRRAVVTSLLGPRSAGDPLTPRPPCQDDWTVSSSRTPSTLGEKRHVVPPLPSRPLPFVWDPRQQPRPSHHFSQGFCPGD